MSRGSGRRRFLARMPAVCALPLLAAGGAQAQTRTPLLDPTLAATIGKLTGGAPLQRGRVRLEMPADTDDAALVPLRLAVDSPMTEADHVRRVYLVSQKNPVREMAVFHFGPHSGRARIVTNVRLADTQTIAAVAQMSDGSCWFATASVEVTVGSCGDTDA